MTRRRIGLALVWLGCLAPLSLMIAVRTTVGDDPKSSGAPAPSIQDALQRPFTFAFAKETSLEDVAAHLRAALRARVVIDRAALDRLDIDADHKVQLELEGVRLKIGLKLLLDQLEMTYRVEPEDNLLILTDAAGTADPIDKILTEVKALHRDVHDVQDALDDVRSALGFAEEDGPKMRKPTIIEVIPAKPGAKPEEPPALPHPKPRRSGV